MSNNNVNFKIIRDFDCGLIGTIQKLEIENLGQDAALNEWQIPVIIRYGRFITAINQNNEIIGVCQAIRCWQNKKTAFIHSFYIVDGFRGIGLGKMFLKYVAELFKSEDFDSIELTAVPENIAAVSLYKGCGFEIVKTEFDEYGRGRNRYLMKLIL
ncbi:MAG: GNAT family N-acetyltransferase [Actinobacteria bacterium]|nr:GNAT family N-acetyltransferase [Actinomycetota bacterium]